MELCCQDRLTCSDAALPTDGANLVLKATELFRRKTGSQHFFNIHLVKRIPIQAGLGGGSSNAASALWGCDQLARTKIPLNILQQWGAEIGSDIPFFFSQGTAYCTGKGESVRPLAALASQAFCIVKPPFGLSTPEVYRRFKSAHASEKELQGDLDRFLAGSLTYFNDLEPPAFELKPELCELKQELLASGFKTVLMSGSGSSFFCMGQGSLPHDPRLKVFPVHFINRAHQQWYSSWEDS